MAKSPPSPDDPDYVYIDKLSKIVDREVNTIRKWCRTGMLPKRLMPKFGFRGWRYWTVTQVYGDNGILEWMKKNNMRPGNLVTDPSKEQQHVANLRRPKYLNGYQINSAKAMVEKGKTAKQIAKKIQPKTKYSSPENCEAALRRYFEAQGWYFPPKERKPRSQPDPVLTHVRTRISRARRAA